MVFEYVPLPPDELIVTTPVPPAGLIVTPVPATIWLTPLTKELTLPAITIGGTFNVSPAVKYSLTVNTLPAMV